MTSSLQLVRATAITAAMLTATDVPETDYAAYAAGTAYGAGDRVIVVADHKVYQSLQAANTGNTPSTSPLWWVEVGPTNRWKAFDLSSSTATEQAGSLYYELTTGSATNAVALLNIVGVTSVRVRVTDPVFGVVYDQTTALGTAPDETGWWAWFFGARSQPTQFLALDLPSYPNAVVRIDLTGAISVGVIMLGQIKTFGLGVSAGVRIGIQDYSRKERNEWGDVNLVQRAYANRASLSLLIANTEIDPLKDALTSVRATPCLWIASESFVATVVFGFYTEFEINIAYTKNSECTLNIEGLT
jgi:hypothetical protein